MATNLVEMKLQTEGLVRALEDARQQLAGAPAELEVDFSTVDRIDSGALRAMEDLADAVEGNGTKLVLRSVNIEVYKVLKLTKLAPRFAFRA